MVFFPAFFLFAIAAPILGQHIDIQEVALSLVDPTPAPTPPPASTLAPNPPPASTTHNENGQTSTTHEGGGEEEEESPMKDLPKAARLVLGIFGLLTFTLIVNNFLEHHNVPIPEAIVTVVIGVIAGVVLVSPIYKNIHQEDFAHFEAYSAKEFFLVLIAPIIFAEGYGMKSVSFFDNITRIASHAFIGTAVSTVIVATIMHNAPQATGFPYQIPLGECLAFGALISATDPVTTLAIFKQMNMVDKGLDYLYYSVLGESILNDAVGIVLFDGFAEFVKEGEEFEPLKDTPGMILSFIKTFGISVILGLACGALAALVLKYARLGGHHSGDSFHFNAAEMGSMLAMSYIPFLIATATPGLSGIVAVLFAGIALRHYAHYNLTMTTRKQFLPVIELIATLAETYVFLLVGMGAVLVSKYDFGIILWAILACLVGRLFNVYPIGFLSNCCSRGRKFKLKEMHVQWFAGLRGAIAFMCALAFPENDKSKNRDIFLCTTIVITFLSMIFFGWPTKNVLGWLKVEEGAQPPLQQEHAHQQDFEMMSQVGGRPDAATAGPARWGAGVVGDERMDRCLTAVENCLVVSREVQEEEARHAVRRPSMQGEGDITSHFSDAVVRAVSGRVPVADAPQRNKSKTGMITDM